MTKSITASKSTIDFGSVQPGQISVSTATISATGDEGVNITELDLTGDPGFAAEAEGLVYQGVSYSDGVEYFLTATGGISTVDDGTGILLGTGNALGGIDLTIEAAGILSSLPTSLTFVGAGSQDLTLSVDNPTTHPATINTIDFPAEFTTSASLPVYVPPKLIYSDIFWDATQEAWYTTNIAGSSAGGYLGSAISVGDMVHKTSFKQTGTGQWLFYIFDAGGSNGFWIQKGHLSSPDKMIVRKTVSSVHTVVATSNTTIVDGTLYYMELNMTGGDLTVKLGTTPNPAIDTGLSATLPTSTYSATTKVVCQIPHDGFVPTTSLYIPTETESNKVFELAHNGEYTHDTANPTTTLPITYSGTPSTGNVVPNYTYNAGTDSGSLPIPVTGT